MNVECLLVVSDARRYAISSVWSKAIRTTDKGFVAFVLFVLPSLR